MFVPDPGLEFFHPGSRVKKIADPVSHLRIYVFLPKTVSRSQKKFFGQIRNCLLANRLPDDCSAELNLD
jgi:hypothetical protein